MSSLNLKRKINHLTPIDDWYTYKDNSNHSYLFNLFNQFAESNVFSNIYVAIRKNPENATEAETNTWLYTNVGFSINQITDYFDLKYGLNYLPYSFTYDEDKTELARKFKSVYDVNLYKYKKLIELMGYRYNPLFNVDGIELYSNAESLGNITNTNTPTGTIKNSTNINVNHNVNPYNANDQNKLRLESNDSGLAENNYTKTSYEDEYSVTNTTTHSSANNGEGTFTVNSKDNAFGTEMTGPERYYVEKRIRQGNIGVTKTQELIQSERDIVRWNILEEFMKDLEKELVVGIY